MVTKYADIPPGYVARGLLYPVVTVAEFHQMLADGVFNDGDPVELREGYLVTKMGHNTPHIAAVHKLRKRLERAAPSGWETISQLPVTLADSEPEPDGYLFRGDEATLSARKPLAADVGLVVEVADSSLREDRVYGGRMYARAGIPLYWIVNLIDGLVEVYTDPDPAADPPAYRIRIDYRPGQDVPVVLDGQPVGAIAVAELLP
ncbi:MAG: Uma2 family endonuclease [Gemmataceae bacterium]|nr:Uma2 family endonuclease [Gemmataceae bacterium]